MIRRVLSAVSVAALCGSVVYAQNVDEPAPAADAQMTVGDADAVIIAAPDAAMVTTKEDARLFGETEFKIADVNADGNVDVDEFVAYATAKSHADAEKVAAAEINGEGDADVTAETKIAMPENTTDAEMAAPEETFAEISDGKEVITEKVLVKARVAAFEEADSNDDETLDDVEKVTFAALVSGRKTS